MPVRRIFRRLRELSWPGCWRADKQPRSASWLGRRRLAKGGIWGQAASPATAPIMFVTTGNGSGTGDCGVEREQSFGLQAGPFFSGIPDRLLGADQLASVSIVATQILAARALTRRRAWRTSLLSLVVALGKDQQRDICLIAPDPWAASRRQVALSRALV